jgi:hypothetical protein
MNGKARRWLWCYAHQNRRLHSGDVMAEGFGSKPSESKKVSWFAQHWALSGIVALVGTCALAGMFFVSVFSILRNSSAAQLALHQAEANPIIVRTIGAPLKTGWIVSGTVNVRGPGGEAELAIPVIGPKGKGTLYTMAVRQQNHWRTTRLAFAKEGESTTQDLLATPDETKPQQ